MFQCIAKKFSERICTELLDCFIENRIVVDNFVDRFRNPGDIVKLESNYDSNADDKPGLTKQNVDMLLMKRATSKSLPCSTCLGKETSSI